MKTERKITEAEKKRTERFNVFLMFGGGGDFLVDWMLIRYKRKKETLILMDHPTEMGFVAFEK